VQNRIDQVAHAPDTTVLVTGQSGTGKELVARALHNFGRRKDGPFVAINMAAIPRDLIESELFGHEKGAMAGAVERAKGKFELAAGGTLFLDEIGDMPPKARRPGCCACCRMANTPPSAAACRSAPTSASSPRRIRISAS
jgi:DNA-binding NtrC family response regulator